MWLATDNMSRGAKRQKCCREPKSVPRVQFGSMSQGCPPWIKVGVMRCGEVHAPKMLPRPKNLQML